jgi:general secretion pathway protein K
MTTTMAVMTTTGRAGEGGMAGAVTRRRRQRGLALILVLWIFMTLGVLALDFGQFMRDDAMAAVNLSDTTQGYYLAVAGMNRAIYELLESRDTGEDRGFLADDFFQEADDQYEDPSGRVQLPLHAPPDGEWHRGEFGGGSYAVRITDEGGRVSINNAPVALIKWTLESLVYGEEAGGSRSRREISAIDTLVDSIVDWRDADDLAGEHGAESEYYLALRPGYRAKNGYFESPEELLYVRGITPDLVYGRDGRPGMRDVFSVYSRRQGVNLRSITAPVLQVLLQADVETAAELIDLRRENGQAFMDQIRIETATVNPVLAQILVDEPPRTLRVEAHADMKQERNRARVATVIDLDSDLLDGPRVLRWLDDAPWPSNFDVGPDGPVVDDPLAVETEAS